MRSRRCPSFITRWTFSRADTSSSGLPTTEITSARLPLSREPASSSRHDHRRRYREYHQNAWLPFCVYARLAARLARPLIKRDCRLRTIPTYGQNRGPLRPVLRMALHLATRPIRLLVLL